MVTALWIDTYRPRSGAAIVGQGKLVEQVTSFLSQPAKGKGLWLHGPPGIGKTAVVEAVAADLGLTLLHMNASDERNTAAIETFFVTSTTKSLFDKGKVLLIDEVDGLSGRSDRGAASALAKLIKQSQHPAIVIANDAYLQKLQPLRAACKIVKVNRVPTPSIQKRLREICKQEGITADETTLKNLARFSNGDLRSAITDLQLAAAGKTTLTDHDLEALGFRERQAQIYTVLPAIFRSHLSAARKLIYDGDKDADEVFLWVAHNVPAEFSGTQLAHAYTILAKADQLRSLVIRQQNYRFKAYMTDLLAGISAFKGESHHYVAYQPPNRIMQLGRTRMQRALRDAAAAKIGARLHCSKRRVLRDVLPYLRVIQQKQDILGTLKILPEEQEAII